MKVFWNRIWPRTSPPAFSVVCTLMYMPLARSVVTCAAVSTHTNPSSDVPVVSVHTTPPDSPVAASWMCIADGVTSSSCSVTLTFVDPSIAAELVSMYTDATPDAAVATGVGCCWPDRWAIPTSASAT